MRYAVLLAFALAGCAITSQVQDAGGGTYLIAAHAAPVRGGAAGASDIAYSDANKFCAQKEAGSHAIVVVSNERDVYQGAVGGGPSGFGGGIFAAGNVDLRFRCGQ